MKLYRQGDVLLKPITEIPKNAKKKDLILAHGEVTGHCHQFVDASIVSVFLYNETQYVEVFHPAELIHDEHGKQLIHVGNYEVVRQREVDLSEEIRKVND